MTIALTSDQRDLAEAVARFTARQDGASPATAGPYHARQRAGQHRHRQRPAEASVLKVISAANLTDLRRAVLDWHSGAAAMLSWPAHDYLSVPPQLIGGGTVEIQLNVIGEQVLGLPRQRLSSF